MKTFEKFGELRKLLEESYRVPLSNSLLIDENKLRELLEDIVMNLPRELAAAEDILNRQAQIIQSAHAKAAEIIEKASNEALQQNHQTQYQLSIIQRDQDLLASSQAQAQNMIEQLKVEASKIQAQAQQEAQNTISRAQDRAQAELKNIELRQIQLREYLLMESDRILDLLKASAEDILARVSHIKGELNRVAFVGEDVQQIQIDPPA